MEPAILDDIMRKEKAADEAERLREANRPRIEIPRPTPPRSVPKKDTSTYIQVL